MFSVARTQHLRIKKFFKANNNARAEIHMLNKIEILKKARNKN